MDLTDFARIGRIVKTHGLAGEVSVAVTGNLPPDRLVGLDVWFVPPPASLRSARILGVRPGPKGPLLQLSGVGDADTADSLRGTTLLARADSLPRDLPPDEAEPDPIGLRVLDEERGDLGCVCDVIVTGANDVWVIDGGAYGQVLIPVIDAVIGDIEWEAGTVNVRLLPGLIEDE